MMNFHDISGKPKTTVLHYRYSKEPFEDASVIKLVANGHSYTPEKDYFLYLGSLNWKITAKVQFKTFTDRVKLSTPHSSLPCYLGQHNGYISNARTPDVQWHVNIKDAFKITEVEDGTPIGPHEEFDIWLTFEPTAETKGAPRFYDWDEDELD